MVTTKKKTITRKQAGRYKPNVGKVFALRKSKNISIKWTTAPAPKTTSYYSRASYLDNSNGDIFALVTDEWTHDVEILYNGHRYKISKFYILYPINDPDDKGQNADLNLQSLVNEYFNLIEQHTNIPSTFIEFGRKLKQTQESIESTVNDK